MVGQPTVQPQLLTWSHTWGEGVSGVYACVRVHMLRYVNGMSVHVIAFVHAGRCMDVNSLGETAIYIMLVGQGQHRFAFNSWCH